MTDTTLGKMCTEESDLPPEVYKVIGAPGTGKTTRVVGNPDIDETSLVMENGEKYPLSEQMIVTYTKAGVNEAAERLYNIIDEPKYKIEERVTTIHSQCFRTLGLDREQVVGWWDKKNFCKTYDLQFEGGDDDGDIMSSDKAEGNLFFDIYGWLKSNRKTIEEYEDCPQQWTGENDFRFLAKRWDQWKEENNKKDFSDMIEGVVEMARVQIENLGWGPLFPDEDTTAMEIFEEARHDENRDPEIIRGKGAFVDTKVLYVDEVQDLTPLQWAWYLAQKLAVEKVYIGGDDDQTIYGWAGANPNFMLDEEGDFEVLDKTYRIPKEVWEVCDGVIQQVDKRQEKDVTPHGDGGEVVTHFSPSSREIADHIWETEGDVFILFRARYMIDSYTDKLHARGIPYENMSTFDTWEDDVVTIRDALGKIYRHKRDEDENYKLTGDEMQVLLDCASPDMLSSSTFDAEERAMGNMTGVSVDRALELFDLNTGLNSGGFSYPMYLSKIHNNDEINYYQKEAIKGSIKNETFDMYPEDVRIGTIHSSKGKEASTVILALDTTMAIAEGMREDTEGVPDKQISDAERRVYYVGMTRASNKLVLAEDMAGSQVTLELSHLLDTDEHGTEQEQTSLDPAKREW